MEFEFDLTPADYIAMSWHCYGGYRAGFRASSRRAVYIFVGLVVFLAFSAPESSSWNVAIAAGVGGLYAGLMPFWWRWKWLRSAQRYYGTDPYNRLFGRQRLVFAEDGIRSHGPHHETLRRWSAITKADFTETHVLISTIFGNVYVLPNAAVPNLPELRLFVDRMVGAQSAS